MDFGICMEPHTWKEKKCAAQSSEGSCHGLGNKWCNPQTITAVHRPVNWFFLHQCRVGTQSTRWGEVSAGSKWPKWPPIGFWGRWSFLIHRSEQGFWAVGLQRRTRGRLERLETSARFAKCGSTWVKVVGTLAMAIGTKHARWNRFVEWIFLEQSWFVSMEFLNGICCSWLIYTEQGTDWRSGVETDSLG